MAPSLTRRRMVEVELERLGFVVEVSFVMCDAPTSLHLLAAVDEYQEPLRAASKAAKAGADSRLSVAPGRHAELLDDIAGVVASAVTGIAYREGTVRGELTLEEYDDRPWSALSSDERREACKDLRDILIWPVASILTRGAAPETVGKPMPPPPRPAATATTKAKRHR